MIVCDGCTGDGAINPYDSNLSGDVTTHLTATYSSDQSFPDPETGQEVNSITVTADPDHLHVDAGYNAGGQTVVHTRFTDPVDPGTAADQQLTRGDVIDNTTTIVDGNGASMAYDPVPGVDAATPLDLMGDMVNADVTAGAIMDVNSTNNSYSLDAPSISDVRTRLSRVTPDGRFTITGVSPDRLLIAETLPNEPGRVVDAAVPRTKNRITVARTNALSAQSHSHGLRFERIFERRGPAWVLAQAKTILDDTLTGVRVHTEHVATFENLRWFKNPVTDAGRRMKRPHPTQVIPVSTTASRSSLTVPGIRRMVSCDALPPDDPGYCGSGGGGGGGGGYVDMGADLGCANDVVGYVHTDGTMNLVLQHGGLSDAKVWCGLEGYLRGNFRIGFEIRHTTTSSQHIEGQTFDLKSRIDGERGGESQFIMVGHSNGGLIARRVAQLTESDPAYVRGVLTISTPHAGFPLAKMQNQAAVVLFQPIVATGCGYVLHIGCSLLGQHVYGYVAGILTAFTLQAGVPATRDDQPGSPYLDTLNSHAEGFARAGIQDYAWDKWTLFRLIGDWQPGPFGNGRRLVKDVDRAYHFGLKCAVVSGIFGFVWPGAWRVAAGCAAFSAQLKGTDLVWKAMSVPHQSGDGIVPGSSQIYPNAPVNNQFGVRDADSHLGVNKRGSTTAPRIVDAIKLAFGVPPAVIQ